MKKTVIALLAIVLSASAVARGSYYHLSGTGSNYSHRLSSGYMKSNGTYVHSYERTTRNSTQLDNYGTKGNYNPYSGKTGHRYATH